MKKIRNCYLQTFSFIPSIYFRFLVSLERIKEKWRGGKREKIGKVINFRSTGKEKSLDGA